MSQTLTRRQQAALDALSGYVSVHGRAPTYAELAHLLGARSTTSAVRLVDQLERKGVVEVDPGTARGIRLLNVASGGESVPSVGTRVVFAAIEPGGTPSRWGSADDGLWVDRHLLPDRVQPDHMGLIRIPDDAMAPSGIRTGDLVVGQPVSSLTILSGDLVICAIDRRYTVRRLRRSGGVNELVPDDDAWPTLPVPPVPLLGTLLALLRRY